MARKKEEPPEPFETWQSVMKGVKVRTNPINGYRILSLHHTADPDKDPDLTATGVEYVKRMREKFPNNSSYEREINLNWMIGDGDPYYDWDRDTKCKSLLVNPGLPILRSWDFGWDVPACVFAQVNKEDLINGVPRVNILYCVEGHSTTIGPFARNQVIPVYSKMVTPDGGRLGFRDCCDPFGGNQKGDKSPYSSIQELQRLRTLPTEEHPEGKFIGINPIGLRWGRLPGHTKVRRVIAAGQLYVDCTFASKIADALAGGFVFPKYKPGQTQEERKLPDHKSIYIHLIDCLRYLIVNFVDFLDSIDEPEKKKRSSRFRGPGVRGVKRRDKENVG